MKFPRLVTLTALLALASGGGSSAQTVVTPDPVVVPTPGVVYQPAPYPPPGAPLVTQQRPRLYRALELLSEPSLLRNPTPYPGYTPTEHPFLDASPNIANLIFLGLIGIDSTALGIASFAVPTALRALRIALYGPPYPMTSREVRLWILLPEFVHLSRTKAATGYYLERPLYQRLGRSGPLFPRLHGQGR